MGIVHKLLLLSILLFFTKIINAQAPADTLLVQDTIGHSPKKATIYSAIIPGLGQVYNKKYWKVPVIYAGFAAGTYFIISNHKNWNIYRTELNNRLSIDGYESEYANYSDDDIKYFKDAYKRYLDLSVISIFVIYAINIVDATVDAHFFNFDISENLSLNITPTHCPKIYSGISLSLSF